MPGAVEELIRYDSPLQLFERTATAEPGSARSPSAPGRRSPRCSARPTGTRRSSPTRTGWTWPLAQPAPRLRRRIHFCLGAPLARVELQASLATLLTDLPGLALAGEPTRHPTFTHRGFATLPVTLHGAELNRS